MSPPRVKIILPGHVYIAPDGFHLLLEAGGRIHLSDAPPENGLRPSVAALFRSVADVYGKSAVGVLLTGMGSDGAEELLQLKRKGAVTIAQDKASSVIYGMPGEAVRLGAAAYVLAPDRIAAMLEQSGENRPMMNYPAGLRGHQIIRWRGAYEWKDEGRAQPRRVRKYSSSKTAPPRPSN